jgi:cobalamin-dependent methionine synthase I
MTKKTDDDELFSQEVHDVVCDLSDWIKPRSLQRNALMPALAVILGRIIAQSVTTSDDLERFLDQAESVMINAAAEQWEKTGHSPWPTH